MFTNASRPSWLSSLSTVVLLGFITLLSGCGGGGASSSNNPAMSVVPAAVTVYAYADTPTTLIIRGGVKPFNVYSANPAIISFNGTTMPGGLVPDETITLGGPTGQYGIVNNVDVATPVKLTVRGADGAQVDVIVTVNPSSLNTSLTITGDATGSICAGGDGVLCSGSQGTASVRATTVTGGAVAGHKIRFRIMDQGATYGFVCNQSLGDCLAIETDSKGHIINLETTTDSNGDALAVLRADVGASTQYATISATDQATGQVLRKQFAIVGQALAVLPTTATWTITDSDPTPAHSYNCTGAATSFYVYGGTPPYTITSTVPSIVTVDGGTTTTVTGSGGTFIAQAACGAEGTANLVVMDATGTVLSTITFVVKFVPVG